MLSDHHPEVAVPASTGWPLLQDLFLQQEVGFRMCGAGEFS